MVEGLPWKISLRSDTLSLLQTQTYCCHTLKSKGAIKIAHLEPMPRDASCKRGHSPTPLLVTWQSTRHIRLHPSACLGSAQSASMTAHALHGIITALNLTQACNRCDAPLSAGTRALCSPQSGHASFPMRPGAAGRLWYQSP